MSALRILALALALTAPASAIADNGDALKRLLSEFLAGAHDPTVHEAFWADDLVYTSSAGERYGKAAILERLADAPARETPAPDYRGEDIEVRVEGRTAVVTFRLVADLPNGSTRSYFNTGVFRHDDGGWRAFAWQATAIPGEADR
jgi:ketosteroid isomerase-like protein